MSIFQVSDNNTSKFVLHDLVSDLTQWAYGGTSFRLEDEIGSNKQWKKLQRARHASYTRGYYDGKKKFEVFHEVGHLRTFLPLLEDCNTHYITNVVLSDILPKFKKLRVLSLSAYSIIGLPKSIGGLRLLSYLSLSCTKIRSLPDSTKQRQTANKNNPQNKPQKTQEAHKRKQKLQQHQKTPCSNSNSINACPKLSGRLSANLPSLKKLSVKACPMLVVSFSSLSLLCEVNASQCESIVWCSSTDNKPMKSMSLSYISEFGVWFMLGFQNVECLKIVRCEELLYMWQNEILLEKPPHVLHNLALLRELCISNCPRLVSIPKACFIFTLGELKISNCKALTSLPKGMKHNNAHLESLEIEGCDSQTIIVKGQLPLSLKYLSVRNCEKLQYLLDDREDASTSSSFVTHKENINHLSTSLLENLNIYNCSSLTCLSTRGQLPDVKYLHICYCSNLKTLSSRGHLPATPENLVIRCCPKPDSIAERFCNNRSIEHICIKRCANLRSIPEGLHSLSSLCEIYIEDCPSLVFFPEGGLPDAIIRVSISRCEKLKALPNCLHNVNFLQDLKVCQCPSLISFPDENFPSSLTSLSVEDPNIYKSLIAWGLHKLTSLRELNVIGCPDAISFPQEEMRMLLPASLIKLTIARFPKLEYLSSKGFSEPFLS